MAELQPLSMEADPSNDVEPLSYRQEAHSFSSGGQGRRGGAMKLCRAAYPFARTRSQGVSAPSFGQVNCLSPLLP